MRQLLTRMRKRISPTRKAAVHQFERGKQWLVLRRRMVSWVAGTIIAIGLLTGFAMEGGASCTSGTTTLLHLF